MCATYSVRRTVCVAHCTCAHHDTHMCVHSCASIVLLNNISVYAHVYAQCTVRRTMHCVCVFQR